MTVVGVHGPDATERTVVLRGNRLSDTDFGAKVTVFGRLRVIQHPPTKIGEKDFVGFTELRIEE